MKCPKCQNLMVTERFTDYQQSGKFQFIGWRCVSCGLILDPLILRRRLEQNREDETALVRKDLVEADH